MSTRRRSLRDRNSAAIAGPEIPTREPATTTPAAGPDPDPEPVATAAPATPAASRRGSGALAPSARPAREANTLTDRSRFGIYFYPGEFDAARAAYLADWLAGGQDDTFGGWLTSILDEHANRSPAQRAETNRHEPPGERGSSRTFQVANDTLYRMRRAIAADHAAGRWPTDSSWAGEAIATAVAAAERREGGALPPPPARLPNRLKR